ncbi:unnamed protein product [Mytilus edulis]|uniref:SCO-spondin n=1 Tax=Mytilus edulis TaxID=6550 RepID=A0A8S3PMQ6_MYTED|nr:unnamed protein product [Mytilus edulis]
MGPKIAGSLPTYFIVILWIITTGTLQWTSAQTSHVCTHTKNTVEEKTDKCTSFLSFTLQGYGLNRTSSFPGMTTNDINNALNKIMSGSKDQDKICYFYRNKEYDVTECCSGYQNGTGQCDTPICTNPCKNGGVCSKPEMCDCGAEFTGIMCEDRKIYAGENERYCYKGATCGSVKADGAENIRLPQADCCALADAQSWGVGSEACTKCIKTEGGTEGIIQQKFNPNFRTCFNFGPFYYRTFDGYEFAFPGLCTYTLAMDKGAGSTPLWHVQSKIIRCDSSEDCLKRFTLQVSGETITLENGLVYINDAEFPLILETPKETPGRTATIMKKGDWTFVTCHIGVSLKVDKYSAIYITLDKSRIQAGSVAGICGDFDDNPSNDKMTRTGDPAPNIVYAANTWTVANEATQCPGAGVMQDYCKTTQDKQNAEQACSTILSGIFSECHKLESPYFLYNLCVNEVCKAGNNSDTVKCEYSGRFAQSCAALDVIVFWRSSNFCPKTCEDGKVYRECSSKCPRTCKTLYSVLPDSCMEDCVSGCECPVGQFIQDGVCVKAEQCQCEFNRKRYNNGETIKNGCNACKCTYGRWQCTEDKCSEMCEIVGINHVTTFDNYQYSFAPASQSCTFSVVMPIPGVTDDPRSDLNIEMSTARCPNMKEDIFCLNKLVIQYRSMRVTLEGEKVHIFDKENPSTGEQELKNIDTQPFHSKHMYIKSASNKYRMVKAFGFKVLFDKRRAVYIYLAPYFANKVIGLCGKYNYQQDDDFCTQNGVVETNAVNFVDRMRNDECQVKEPSIASNPTEDTTAKQECIFLNPDQGTLNPEQGSLFGSCLEVTDKIQYYYDKCVQDNLARNGISIKEAMCDMVAAFARHCSLQGEAIDWGTYGTLQQDCHDWISCSNLNGMQYKECGKLCSGNCRDFEIGDSSCEEECIPGCQCPDGEFLDDHGECVKRSDCTCYDKYSFGNKVWEHGENITRQCAICTCLDGAWDCDHNECEDIVCPKNQEYIEADSICNVHKTCANIDLKMTCNDNTHYKGCGCTNGTVMAPDGSCVEPERCPCMYGHDYYKEGDEVTIKCIRMKCQNRHFIKVGEVDCPGTCWVYGDPHYTTFDGKGYAFQGSCKYFLVATDDNSFSVTVENVPCGTTSVTCTKSTVITIKSTVIHLIRGEQVKIGNTPLTSDQYNSEGLVVSTHSYWTVIKATSLGIAVLWDGGTRVEVSLNKTQWMGKVKGLCGNFDGLSESGEMMTKEGSEATSIIEFAKSWTVDTTCDDSVTAESTEGPCTGALSNRLKWAEASCNIINEDLFKECRQAIVGGESKVEEYYKNCLYDSCKCDSGGDCECLCTAVAMFAEKCNEVGKPVKWRNPRFCPIMCPYGYEYKACGKPCPQTCRNIGDEPDQWCESTYCVEGCFCPDGYVETTTRYNSTQCIPANECNCVHNGRDYPPGTSIIDNCMNCTCINGKFQCFGTSCEGKCEDDEFMCTNGDCIDKMYYCDGHPDCNDGSDEKCNVTCPLGTISCDVSNTTCIPLNYMCDSRSDCINGMDERDCTPTCSEDEFKCDSGKCISKKFRCDKYYDCGTDDLSDEVNCTTECSTDEFVCSSTFKCIPFNLKCDGHDDCGDGLDEQGCTTTTSVATTTMELTTTTECVKYKVPLDASNLVSPTKPLLTSDITALTEDNAEVVQIPSETFILKISGLDDEINGLKISGVNIGSISVTYSLPESPLAPVAVEVPNIIPGQEIPLESRLYNEIVITITKTPGSANILLDDIEVLSCAKTTTPLPTTTAQPTTMAATTTTECVKNNVFLDDSNVVSPSKPLSPTDIEALTEANDNKVVEIPLLSEVVIEISDLNDEINGLKVVGQNIGTIAVVYYLPESPLVPVTLETNIVPGLEIPIESRLYDKIVITITKTVSPGNIVLDQIGVLSCAKQTSVTQAIPTTVTPSVIPTTLPTGTTTPQATTLEVTTTTECVKTNIMPTIDGSKIDSSTVTLSVEDKNALRDSGDNKFVEITKDTFVLEISDVDDQVNGLKVLGTNIASITVDVSLPESPTDFSSVPTLNVLPGEEIPLELKTYDVIRITVTKVPSSPSISLDSVAVHICGELTTVSMGTTTQPSTIEVTTATECVKEKVVLGESNIDTNNPLAPLSTSDKDALQEKDDNKFVETNESIMVLLIDGLDEEVNGVTVSGDGIATITVKYNLPDNPEFITVQAPNVQPGEEIPLESKKYNIIRITVTKQSGSSTIRLDSVELSTCAKLTTVPVVITTSLPPSTPVTSPTEKPPTTSALPTTVPQTPPTGITEPVTTVPQTTTTRCDEQPFKTTSTDDFSIVPSTTAIGQDVLDILQKPGAPLTSWSPLPTDESPFIVFTSTTPVTFMSVEVNVKNVESVTLEVEGYSKPQLATTSLVSFKLPEGVDSSVFKLIFVPSGDLIPVISNLQIEVCYEGTTTVAPTTSTTPVFITSAATTPSVPTSAEVTTTTPIAPTTAVTTPGVTTGENVCEYECSATLKCIEREQLCDGKDDCGDNEDEMLCSTSASTILSTTLPASTQEQTTRGKEACKPNKSVLLNRVLWSTTALLSFNFRCNPLLTTGFKSHTTTETPEVSTELTTTPICTKTEGMTSSEIIPSREIKVNNQSINIENLRPNAIIPFSSYESSVTIEYTPQGAKPVNEVKLKSTDNIKTFNVKFYNADGSVVSKTVSFTV